MPVITTFSYPVQVDLIHNGTPIGTIDDGFGDVSIYSISSIHYINHTSVSWRYIAADTKGRTYTGTITANQERTINIPAGLRFDSHPLSLGISLIRA